MPDSAAVYESFLRDVAGHKMTILQDNGVYRHVRFAAPGDCINHFELVTWPGHLCVTGDIASFVFSRVRDMFEFFRPAAGDASHISPDYWAQKLVGVDKHSSYRTFSPAAFQDVLKDYLSGWTFDSPEVEDAVRAEVEDIIERASSGVDGQALIEEALEFSSGSGHVFDELEHHDFTEHTQSFLWCLYAITWGICQYDRHAASRPAEK